MSKKKYNVVGEGIECSRCGKKTEARAHISISEKQLNKQPFYYTKWFNCNNRDCKTTLIMLDEHKVWNKNPAASKLKETHERYEKLKFIKEI